MPVEREKKLVLVTSALPYANGSLHLGHMVEYVQTDVFVRFLRMSGREVVYACADDTHGAPIEIAASKQGLKPEELIGIYDIEHQKDFSDFLISFDVYHTTHSDENKRYSDLFFKTLKQNGFIYERMVEQTYCENDKRFLPDRFVKGTCPKCSAADQYGDQCEKCNSVYKPIDLVDARCIICGASPVRKTSTHYFFKLSDFSAKLKDWITSSKTLQPEIRNFVLEWIGKGLEDWDITRDGPYFGFKIPGELNKYYYVWLDAPIGYISASEKFAKEKLGKDASIFWNSEDAEVIHFIGKDIIYFHLLFWPAMLMGVGYNLPSDIVVHGHLTINGEKMSKSRGNFFTAREYLEKYDPELLRFYYAYNLSKTVTDINLDFSDFQGRINHELVSNISNLFYRTINFVNNNFDSKLGKVPKSNHDAVLAAQVQEKCDDVLRNYAAFNYREAVKGILEISSIGNKYIQDNEPWKLVKKDPSKCRDVMTLAANIVKNISILVFPVMPSFSVKIWKQLALENLSFSDLNFGLSGHSINRGRILLTPLEEVPQLGRELFPASLRVGEIASAEEHPDADKLYILQVNLGSEKRQLVAGLRGFYTKEELVGRRIIVVANLKHATIRGVESQGMLLAADSNGGVRILSAPKAGLGEPIFVEGLDSSDAEITIDKLYSLGLSVEGKRIFYGERMLKTSKGEVVVDAEDGSRIR